MVNTLVAIVEGTKAGSSLEMPVKLGTASQAKQPKATHIDHVLHNTWSGKATPKAIKEVGAHTTKTEKTRTAIPAGRRRTEGLLAQLDNGCSDGRRRYAFARLPDGLRYLVRIGEPGRSRLV